jgi:hypothetical protein
MKLSFPIEVRFERIKRDANGDPGRVHLTVNGAPLCETWSRQTFQQHKSGVERVTIQEFLDNGCGNDLTGAYGQSCLQRLQP